MFISFLQSGYRGCLAKAWEHLWWIFIPCRQYLNKEYFFNNFIFAYFDKCFYFQYSFEALAAGGEAEITFSENMFVITRNKLLAAFVSKDGEILANWSVEVH